MLENIGMDALFISQVCADQVKLEAVIIYVNFHCNLLIMLN